MKSGLTGSVECSKAERVSEFIGDKFDSGVVGPGDQSVGSGSQTDRLALSLFNRQSVGDVTARRTCCRLTPQRHVTEPHSYHLHVTSSATLSALASH